MNLHVDSRDRGNRRALLRDILSILVFLLAIGGPAAAVFFFILWQQAKVVP